MKPIENEITIWEGRWSTGDILVADHKLTADNMVIVENGFGEGRYYLSGKIAREFPLEQMPTKKGGKVAVRVIPLVELEKEIIEL